MLSFIHKHIQHAHSSPNNENMFQFIFSWGNLLNYKWGDSQEKCVSSYEKLFLHSCILVFWNEFSFRFSSVISAWVTLFSFSELHTQVCIWCNTWIHFRYIIVDVIWISRIVFNTIFVCVERFLYKRSKLGFTMVHTSFFQLVL